MRRPEIDLGECTKCEGCFVLAPTVFRRNDAADYIEVVEMDEYPESEVDDAIRDCPEDCIYWVED